MIVKGEGPSPSAIMLVGEAPGWTEDRTGRPFCGRSGEVLTEALNRASLPRETLYVTNLVKERLVDKKGNDRPPTDEETAKWAAEFDRELKLVKPRIIVTLGRTSTRHFIPELDAVGGMETVHGTPRERTLVFKGAQPNANKLLFQGAVFPCYHPAAGLHSPRTMTDFFWDIKQLGVLVRAGIKLDPPLPLPHVIGLDTEGTVRKPWCYTDSDSGFFKFHPKPRVPFRPSKGRKTVFHNALHDLQVFDTMKIPVKADHDTMVMAYLLNTEPKGLKELLFRHFDVQTPKYEDMVAEADRRIMSQWFAKVQSMEWPAPEGRKQPISQRLWTLLQKLTLGWSTPIYSEDSQHDPRQRVMAGVQPPSLKKKKVGEEWHPPLSPSEIAKQWEDNEVRPLVEKVAGPLPRATLADIPLSTAREYAVKDAVETRRLMGVLYPKIVKQGLQRAYEMDMAVVPMIAGMERTGLLVDRERLAHARAEISKHREAALERLRDYTASPEFNPASSPQVALIFAADGVEINKRTKSGAVSTGKNVLKALMGEYQFAADVYRFREADKLLNTFIPAIEDNIQDDGRVHPHFRITNTETGRLSAHTPNLLAFPVRSDLGKLIRGCFVAGPGRMLLGADLDQVEMRILADESGDETMVRVIREGLDMHAYSASKIFSLPIKDCGKKGKYAKTRRDPCKSAGFLIAYEGGSARLQEQMEAEGLKEPKEFYDNIIRGWYSTFPGVRRYQIRRHNEAHTYGFVRDRWGRIRHVEGVWCPDSGISKGAEREAGNFPIQAGAQGQIKHSMGLMARNERLIGPDRPAKPLLQIHDEVILEVDENRVDEVEKFVVECLTDLESYKVPITASSSVGRYWSDLK